jgi:hypothetical protein
VQAFYLPPPLGYYTFAIFEFLEGDRVRFDEAEAACPDSDCIGQVRRVDDDRDFSRYSGAAGREAAEGESGVLVRAAGPTELVAGGKARVAMVLEAIGGSEPLDGATAVGTIAWVEGGVTVASKELRAGALAFGDTAPTRTLLRQYQDTWLGFTPVDPANGYVEFSTTGAATLRVDSVAWLIE